MEAAAAFTSIAITTGINAGPCATQFH